MTYRVATVGAIAVLAISLFGTAWAQNDQNNDSRPSLKQPAPGQTVDLHAEIEQLVGVRTELQLDQLLGIDNR